MDITKFMPNIKDYIPDNIDVYKPSENAPKGLSVPGIVMEYGNLSGKIKDLPIVGFTMIKTIFQLKKSYKDLSVQPSPYKKHINPKDLLELNKLTSSLGVNQLAFTTADPSLIFDDKVILFKNAIVLVMEMKPDKIKTAPSKLSVSEIFRTYHDLGVAVNVLSDFLKSKGYRAQAGPALGGETNYPLLAQQAGLGAVGKHGLLITPEYGPSLRLAVVYTDIENLPIISKNPHMWIKDFCDTCNRCVRKCPADAIYKESIIINNNIKQIDYTKCVKPFSNNHGCTVCVKECTFFNNDYNTIKSRFNK